MFSEEKAIKQLAEIYNESFTKITKRIVNAKIEGKSTYSDSLLLKDLNKTLVSLRSNNIEFAKTVIPKVYGRTQSEVIQFFTKNNIINNNIASFGTLHTGAINELVANIVDDLDGQLIQIGRKSKDILKEVTEKGSALNTAGATTKSEAIKNMTDLLIKKGIDKVKYKNGVTTSIVDYITMSTSSVISASINRATVNQSLAYGNNYVQMSFHSTSCPVCAPYQGRIYSLEGDTEYPNISVINNGAMVTYGIIHPNCRHRLLPYIPSLDLKRKANEKASNKDFKDNRTDWSIKRYDKRVKSTRYKRNIKVLKQENEILKSIDDTDDKLKKNKEKIKSYNSKVKDIKAWEIDGMKDNELFK